MDTYYFNEIRLVIYLIYWVLGGVEPECKYTEEVIEEVLRKFYTSNLLLHCSSIIIIRDTYLRIVNNEYQRITITSKKTSVFILGNFNRSRPYEECRLVVLFLCNEYKLLIKSYSYIYSKPLERILRSL